MEMERIQFEAGFQLITAVSNQLLKVDFDEMQRWIDNIMTQKAVTDPNARDQHERLRDVMGQYKILRQTLIERGVPIRDPEHFKRLQAEQAAAAQGAVLQQEVTQGETDASVNQDQPASN